MNAIKTTYTLWGIGIFHQFREKRGNDHPCLQIYTAVSCHYIPVSFADFDDQFSSANHGCYLVPTSVALKLDNASVSPGNHFQDIVS